MSTSQQLPATLAVAANIITTTETGEANNNSSSSSRRTDHVSPCILISFYLALIVNTMLMSADSQAEKRPALIAWCTVESMLRLLVVYITARNYSATFTINNFLGIFLGKEYYLTLVTSIWPDSDPLDAAVDLPGIRIDFVWLKQGFLYLLYNLLAGISLWVVTWKDLFNDENNLDKWLATTGLIACLFNITSYLVGIASMAWAYRSTDSLS
ncbi:3285_t:CDS:2 [Paraglomus occultum]|uniref:3285_t:CDS:1 n=1 Tax=Paraglomus occultum TaxID=144539 RepID=A0A9N9GML3_9GLOM|nr:3285_t:CDS:2 [Paraglomus occultum]